MQNEYLTLVINELNKNNRINMKNIFLEEIQKCGIILDKNVYD